MHRTFLPVGQGAFYCERFEGDGINKKEVINVVYDCGSSTGIEIVEHEIRKKFTLHEKINALIISHFHEDHIQEIPHILSDIQRETKCNSIFISGAAHEYGTAWEYTAPQFIRALVKELYQKHYKIIPSPSKRSQ